jgi:hypothetical protein
MQDISLVIQLHAGLVFFPTTTITLATMMALITLQGCKFPLSPCHCMQDISLVVLLHAGLVLFPTTVIPLAILLATITLQGCVVWVRPLLTAGVSFFFVVRIYETDLLVVVVITIYMGLHSEPYPSPFSTPPCTFLA